MIDSKTYRINNSTVRIVYGDLLDSKADVIVISGSVGVPMRGGLPGAVRHIAGEQVAADAAKHPEARLGDVVVTGAGNLPNKYMFHAVTVGKYHKVLPEMEREADEKVLEYILGHAIRKSFHLLSAMDLNSIAFPCLGLGMANMPMEAVAKKTAKSMAEFLTRTNRSIEVEIYIKDSYGQHSRFDYLPYFEWFAAYSHLTMKDAEKEEKKDAEVQTGRWEKFKDVVIRDFTQSGDHRVFISYSRRDSAAVLGIVDMLNKMNIPYWIDVNGVWSGANFKEKIVNAIASTDLVLFLSSAHSNESSNVAKEISLADKYGKVVIPVRIDNTPLNPKIDYDLSGIDYVDLTAYDEKSFGKLRNAILGQLTMTA